MSVRFSIITICYNAAKVLPVTIESVLAQDYCDFEYVIQDGDSTDETPDIVESYKDRFEAKGISFIYNREKDGGIYDAMNRGSATATGDYVKFMNAGDCLYAADVLSKVASAIEENGKSAKEANPVIVYGDCAVYEYGSFFRFAKDLSNIEENMPFSHQTVFAAKDFVKVHPFDTKYRYSADYDFLLCAHDEGAEFLDSGCIVAITTADGLSSVRYRDTMMESVRILKAHGVFRHSEEDLARRAKSLKLKQFVLDHFPVSVKKAIRKCQIKKRGQNINVIIPKWFENML